MIQMRPAVAAILITCAHCSLSCAAPAPMAVSGIVANGQSITITGTGFGGHADNNANRPYICKGWENFESGVADSIFSANYGPELVSGGSAITTGVKADLEIPWNATITSSTLVCDQSGSIVLDLWRDTYANYPATVADTITASAKPTLSAATKAQNTTLTGWTTALTAGDILRVNVDSAATVTRCTLSLQVAK